MPGLQQAKMIRSGSVKYHPSLSDLLTPIEEVQQHPQNPNSGDIEAIATSIEVNGMYRPVYAQRSTRYILAGNTTYQACLSLEAEIIPVVWLEVDDETATRILLGDNQLARLALIDEGLLQPHLDALLQTELRLLGTGYVEAPQPEVPPEPEPAHTITIHLTGERMVQWFDIPGEGDREKLFWLIDLR